MRVKHRTENIATSRYTYFKQISNVPTTASTSPAASISAGGGQRCPPGSTKTFTSYSRRATDRRFELIQPLSAYLGSAYGHPDEQSSVRRGWANA